jgi:hypothetical protein
MLLLAATTDTFQLISSTTSALDVHVSYVDASSTTLVPSGAGKQNTAIVTATTTTILAAPAASTVRNMKTLKVRNKGAVANDVTIQFDQNATDFELHKVTLLAGECLQYIEGIGFFVLTSGRLDRWLRVSADVVNATTSFADVTGLTCAVESGKTYNFEAHLTHINNATTTGSRFGINGPTLSAIRVSTIDTVTASVTASVHSAGSVTAVDTAATAQTTGSANDTLAILSGSFTTGAAGTFAIRSQSEVAVAAGLTVRAGSWCHVWEPTG